MHRDARQDMRNIGHVLRKMTGLRRLTLLCVNEYHGVNIAISDREIEDSDSWVLPQLKVLECTVYGMAGPLDVGLDHPSLERVILHRADHDFYNDEKNPRWPAEVLGEGSLCLAAGMHKCKVTLGGFDMFSLGRNGRLQMERMCLGSSKPLGYHYYECFDEDCVRPSMDGEDALGEKLHKCLSNLAQFPALKHVTLCSEHVHKSLQRKHASLVIQHPVLEVFRMLSKPKTYKKLSAGDFERTMGCVRINSQERFGLTFHTPSLQILHTELCGFVHVQGAMLKLTELQVWDTYRFRHIPSACVDQTVADNVLRIDGTWAPALQTVCIYMRKSPSMQSVSISGLPCLRELYIQESPCQEGPPFLNASMASLSDLLQLSCVYLCPGIAAHPALEWQDVPVLDEVLTKRGNFEEFSVKVGQCERACKSAYAKKIQVEVNKLKKYKHLILWRMPGNAGILAAYQN
eukprot:Colp12_sorted_trinity150504_noHs@8897